MLKYLFFFIFIGISIPAAFATISLDHIEIKYANTNMTINNPIDIKSLTMYDKSIGMSKQGESERIYNFSRTGGGFLNIELTSFDTNQINFQKIGAVVDIRGNVSGTKLADIKFDSVSQTWTFDGTYNLFTAGATNLMELFFNPADFLVTVFNADCNRALDIAWTVMGILPVSLFFATFVIMGSLNKEEE